MPPFLKCAQAHTAPLLRKVSGDEAVGAEPDRYLLASRLGKLYAKAMPTVGEQLREAREQQKLPLDKIEELTKIRPDHLRALEAGRYDAFSAPVYVRGFVRSYASALKLNPANLLAELDKELARSKKFQESPPLSGVRTGPLDFLMLQLSRLDWRVGAALLTLVLTGLVIFGIYRAWRHYATYDPLASLGPGFYQPHRTNAGVLLPLPNR